MENLNAVIEGNTNSKAAAMFVAVLAELSDIYKHYNLGSHQDFIQEVLVNQFKSGMTGEKCWKLLNDAAENPNENKNINLKYGLMMISGAYCADALKALQSNDEETAWVLVAQAQHWCGRFVATRGLENAQKDTITATLSNSGSIARDARTEKEHGKTKRYAQNLARDKCPPGKWRSRNAAAVEISEDVYQFSKDYKELSYMAVTERVNEWLAEMEDANQLFNQSKRGRPKK